MAIGITAIRVRGFRSHVDTYVKLTPIGLNVVTGKTDSGKTALTIQAIRWVALGEPSGDEFIYTKKNEAGEIMEQAEECYVALELSTGVVVEKTRRKNKTIYQLSTVPEPFEQAAVPEEVKAALEIRKKYFGDYEVDLNFAYQMAAPFLISETGSAGAKVLGTLAGTEAVDAAFKGVGKEQYAARTARQQADKEAQQKEADLKQYAELDALAEQFKACEYLLSEAEGATIKRDKLYDISSRYLNFQLAVTDAEAELERLTMVPELAVDLENVEKAQQRYERLLDLYERKGRLDERVDQLGKELAKYEALPLAAAYLEEIENNQARVISLSSLSALYTQYSQEVRRTTEIMEGTKDLDLRTDDLRGLENASVKLENLKRIVNAYDLAADQVTRYAAALELTKGMGQAAELLRQATDLQQKLTALYDLDTRHDVKQTTYEKAAGWEITAGKDVARYTKDLAEAWEAAGGVCPLCDGPIAEGSCKH